MKRFIRKFTGTVLLLAATIATGMILTAGIFTDEIKMKNVDGPFIDLDVMVEDLPISAEGGDFAEDGNDKEGAAETEEKEEAEDVIQEFVISIRETEISFNGSKVSSSNFKGIFDAIHENGVPVRLIDDYAEYHTYKSVLEYLTQKGIKPVEEKL